MAIKSIQVAVPADGSVVQVVDTSQYDPLYGDEVSYRNTGTVNLLLGGPDAQFYPLQAASGFGEAYSTAIAEGDVMNVRVATVGTAGQITAIKAR